MAAWSVALNFKLWGSAFPVAAVWYVKGFTLKLGRKLLAELS